MYFGAGKDAFHSRRDCGGHIAIWHADFRSVSLGPVPGRPDQLRNRTRKRLQRRRLQAAYARHRINRRHLAASDAVIRLRPLSFASRTPGARKRAFFCLTTETRRKIFHIFPRRTLWLRRGGFSLLVAVRCSHGSTAATKNLHRERAVRIRS